jgi:hypothetical protein
MTPFEQAVRPEDVGELIDLTVEGDPDTRSMAQMQLEGIAAIYAILCRNRFAYLADEVGMGKTYQAMGLAALLWNEKANARILFVSPRENLQLKWFEDYLRFFATNYRRKQGVGDDRAASILFNEAVHRPILFPNLRTWIPTLGMPDRVAAFVRHTSFTRPVYLTAADTADLEALWERTERQLRSWGLFHVERPRNLTPANASESLNLASARALNAKLEQEGAGEPYFDLVIVDETQCLRNPGNQTNRVLFESLQGQVRRWLFMSATPVHGGPEDLPTILNHYPGCGQVLDPALTRDLPAMQRALQTFLVRRQRRYRVRRGERMVGKDLYRRHDPEGWGVRDQEMSPLSTLAMGLVQKGLVQVLQGRSNRFRIGFLSSFESLQASLGRAVLPPADADAADEESTGDWHRDQADGHTEPEAPDAAFIQRLTQGFEARFGRPLPHPKVDSVVDRIAPLAYGTEDAAGGHKFLVFTRRVSTVETLRDRLDLRFHEAVEARVRRCWGVELDWSGRGLALDESSDDDDDPEAAEHLQGKRPIREATSRGGWLYRYRQTFRASGRNALFFEDGWLERLCRAGGVDPAAAADALPDELWAESWSHASRAAGARRQQHRAARLRYIAVHAVRRCPEVFGLQGTGATPWRRAYEAALHEHLERAEPDGEPHRAPELFSFPTLWTRWDERFPAGALALPAADPGAAREHGGDDLCRRQVARALIGQSLRLTDTLIDLFFADQQCIAAGAPAAFPDRFLDWLSGSDPSARMVRGDCAGWIAHLRLIVDGCLEGAGRPWRELARVESWPQLYNPLPVIGVTGGSGAHRTAIRQFRTPSLPRVIVCTDTLKEGVDLHLFCDRVLHYGVAWTSGDLEQRVGRVDRFFSQIERRLNDEGAPPEVELHIGYPHVVSSLERAQVERVIARQKAAEALMDSPLAGAVHEERELVAGASAPRVEGLPLDPYRPQQLPRAGRPVVAVSEQAARASFQHYAAWYRMLRAEFHTRGWRLAPSDDVPVRLATLHGPGHQHELAWAFDSALERYVLTVSQPRRGDSETFLGGLRRRVVARTRREERFVRVLVPTPSEGLDEACVQRLAAALDATPVRADADALRRWTAPLEGLSGRSVQVLGDHQARVQVARGDRTHEVTLYAYVGGVRVVGVVAPLDALAPSDRWGGAPAPARVREWALDTNHELGLGYLDVHPLDGLVFGVHALHGELPAAARRALVQQVAWRADAWEAALTGLDAR